MLFDLDMDISELAPQLRGSIRTICHCLGDYGCRVCNGSGTRHIPISVYAADVDSTQLKALLDIMQVDLGVVIDREQPVFWGQPLMAALQIPRGQSVSTPEMLRTNELYRDLEMLAKIAIKLEVRLIPVLQTARGQV